MSTNQVTAIPGDSSSLSFTLAREKSKAGFRWLISDGGNLFSEIFSASIWPQTELYQVGVWLAQTDKFYTNFITNYNCITNYEKQNNLHFFKASKESQVCFLKEKVHITCKTQACSLLKLCESIGIAKSPSPLLMRTLSPWLVKLLVHALAEFRSKELSPSPQPSDHKFCQIRCPVEKWLGKLGEMMPHAKLTPFSF